MIFTPGFKLLVRDMEWLQGSKYVIPVFCGIIRSVTTSPSHYAPPIVFFAPIAISCRLFRDDRLGRYFGKHQSRNIGSANARSCDANAGLSSALSRHDRTFSFSSGAGIRSPFSQQTGICIVFLGKKTACLLSTESVNTAIVYGTQHDLDSTDTLFSMDVRIRLCHTGTKG